SGLHDPNGPKFNYNGFGYTGTLLDGPCPHYFEPGRAKVGALVVFGPGTGEHAAMVLEPDPRNPLLFSHGGERGPLAIRLHDEVLALANRVESLTRSVAVGFKNVSNELHSVKVPDGPDDGLGRS